MTPGSICWRRPLAAGVCAGRTGHLQAVRAAVQLLAPGPLPIGELRPELGCDLLRPVLDRPLLAVPLTLVGEKLDAGPAARGDALHAARTPIVRAGHAFEAIVGPVLGPGRWSI